MRTAKLAWLIAAAILTTSLGLCGASAHASARPHADDTIMQDDASFLYGSDAEVAAAMARAKELGVDRVRLTADWAVLAPETNEAQRPAFDASDPSAYTHNGFSNFDPVNYWYALDRAVRAANQVGLRVMIDVGFWAPRWAAPTDPRGERRTIGINPADYSDFVKATVKRYSGTYVPSYGSSGPSQAATSNSGSSQESTSSSGPSGLIGGLALPLGGGTTTSGQASPQPPSAPANAAPALPQVSMWTIWNEPNHPGFLQPQWQESSTGFAPNSPYLYRQLVDAAFPVIKQLAPDSTVLIGATSSIGATRPHSTQDGMAPLAFLRALACVDRSLRPIDSGPCAGYTPLEGDGWSHHPYELLHTPDWSDSRNPDTAMMGDLGRLTRLLNRLVAMGRIAPSLRRVWLTEFGYESNPPDPIKPFSPIEQAKLINWAEYLAWRNPDVQSFAQFLLNDMGTVSSADAARGKRTWGDWQSGLYFRDGTPKPAATSFALAMHVDCQTIAKRRRYLVWGHVRPGAGVRTVTLQRFARKKSVAVNVQTDSAGYFTRAIPYTPGARFRIAHQNAAGITQAPDSCSGRTRQKRVTRSGLDEY